MPEPRSQSLGTKFLCTCLINCSIKFNIALDESRKLQIQIVSIHYSQTLVPTSESLYSFWESWCKKISYKMPNWRSLLVLLFFSKGETWIWLVDLHLSFDPSISLSIHPADDTNFCSIRPIFALDNIQFVIIE